MSISTMKPLTLLMVGLVLSSTGIFIQLKAETWSLFSIDPPELYKGNAVCSVDTSKEKAYELGSKELAVFGVILTSIAAFRWTQKSQD
jgi:hypothetical protein